MTPQLLCKCMRKLDNETAQELLEWYLDKDNTKYEVSHTAETIEHLAANTSISAHNCDFIFSDDEMDMI